LNTATRSPYAAPIESRFRRIAEGEQQRPERAQQQHVGGEQHRQHEPGEPLVGEVEEVDAARRPAAREHARVRRKARGRGDLVAQTVDEVHALRLAVLAAADRLEMQVAT
jgi:hypothetical protein